MNNLGVYTDYKEPFYALGYFGEYITFFITCSLIYSRYIYFFFYLITFVFNRFLNTFLKNTLKEETPNNPIKFLESEQFTKTNYRNPSGHVQVSFFSFMYAYLVLGQMTKLIFLSFIVCIITIYQRYMFRNHTLKQLLFGAVLGLLTAYVSYSLVNFIQQII